MSTETPSNNDAKQDAKHAARGGGTNLLAVIAGLALPAYHTLVARVYGAGAYGLYALGLGIIDLVARLANVGTDKGVLRHIPAHRIAGETQDERRALTTAFWLAAGGGALLAGAVALLAAPLARLTEKPATEAAIRLLAPSTPFVSLVVVLVSATMAAKVMRFNLLVRGLAQPLLLLAIALPVGLYRSTLEALCISHLVASALAALLALWAVKRVFADAPLRSYLAAGPPHWEMVRFSIPFGLSELLNAVLQRADVILVSLYVSKERLGTYAAAELLSRAVSNARYAFDPVASPVLSEALRLRDHQRLRYNLQLMSRWVTLLTFPIVTFVIGFREELLSLFGKGFVAAADAFLVLCLGHIVNSTLGLTGWVLAMAGRSKLILFNNLLAASLNVALCLALAPRYGLVGASVAAAGSVTFAQLLSLFEVLALEKVHAFGWPLFKVFLAGAATLLGMLWATPRFVGPVWLRLTYGTLAMLVAYCVLLAVLGLAEEERDIVRKVLARRR
ncbi:MAG: oligosaccharide flippase family protein [Myxococcales bacterium]|nr:oligosaccharide flippase family protein [Myxococcales bacterium]